MKIYRLIFLLVLLLIGCQLKQNKSIKKDNIQSTKEHSRSIPNDTVFNVDRDIEELYQQSQLEKKQLLLAIPDDKVTLQELVATKTIYKEDDFYILDYTYPVLNEQIDPGFKIFNNYLTEHYLNTERTINEILEDKELICDTLSIDRFREKRIVDYKLHSTANDIISILMYKENFYSGMKHSAYLFDCLNFDRDKNQFIYFNDVFKPDSEQEIFTLINNTISNDIRNGNMYYDCWEISPRDFQAYKNNFVINDEHIAFYFDDCIVCPSYTGTYSINIPIVKVLHLIQYYSFPILG